MVPIVWPELLGQVWKAALKNWRVILVLLAAGAVALYVRGAEKAKQALEETKQRAAAAESLYVKNAAASAALGRTADSLRVEIKDTDAEWASVVRRLRAQARARDTLRSSPVSSPDSTEWATEDTTPEGCPNIELLIRACDARVAARDSLITVLHLRRSADSSTINDLRNLVPGAIFIAPKPPSRIRRVVETTAVAAVGAAVGQQVSGQKGLIIGSSLGALLGLIR